MRRRWPPQLKGSFHPPRQLSRRPPHRRPRQPLKNADPTTTPAPIGTRTRTRTTNENENDEDDEDDETAAHDGDAVPVSLAMLDESSGHVHVEQEFFHRGLLSRTLEAEALTEFERESVHPKHTSPGTRIGITVATCLLTVIGALVIMGSKAPTGAESAATVEEALPAKADPPGAKTEKALTPMGDARTDDAGTPMDGGDFASENCQPPDRAAALLGLSSSHASHVASDAGTTASDH